MVIKISFTQFMNYAVKNGSPRITQVRKIKNSDDYHPGKDYWKEFRDKVKNIHSTNKSISELDTLLTSVNAKKVSNYRQAINKYKAFVKGKNISWFNPPKSSYSYGDVTINVSHELGLYINGKPYLIKMLLSKEAEKYAMKSNVQTTLALSYAATEFNDLPENTISMVLIVGKNKTYQSTFPGKDSLAMLNAEISGFEILYNNL